MNVKRLDIKLIPQMDNSHVEYQNEDGRYVLYDDHAKLESENTKLKMVLKMVNDASLILGAPTGEVIRAAVAEALKEAKP